MQNQVSLIDRFVGWHNTTHDTRCKLLSAFCQGITSRSIILNMLTMGVLHFFQSDAIPILSWMAWIALITLCGIAIRLFARRVEANPVYFEDPRRTAAIFFLVGGIYGLTWGLGLSFFFLSGNPLDKGIVLFITTFSSTIGPYAPMPGFSQMRFVVTVIPFLISLILVGDRMFGLLVFILSAWLFVRFNYTHGYRKVLTTQYELASELETRGQQLNHANKVKDNFLAAMSHELRTPLNGILGLARLQRTEALSEENLKRSNLIENSGRTLLNIINGILDSIEAPRQALQAEYTVFDLHETVSEVCEVMSARAFELGRPAIDIDIGNDVPTWVTGDGNRLRHVIYNLISNAIDFSRDAPVRLSVTMDGETTGFSVSDDGAGIANEDLDLIFDRFSQLDNQPAGRIGTGLGLSIARDIVDVLGGELRVESTPGEGSEFHFDLQFEKADRPVEVPVIALEPVSSSPLSILLVEDLVMNQIVATQMLENAGHDITIAATGAEAIDAYRRGNFGVILLDINLPDMGGVEVAQKIRASDANIPIFAVTANAFTSDQQAYLEAGMNGVIRKPLEQEELDRCLASIATTAAAADNNDIQNDVYSVANIMDDLSILDVVDNYSVLDVVDIKYLDKMCLEVGDEVFRQMLDIFETHAPEALDELQEAIEAADMAGIQSGAHKMASMSGSVALLKLSLTFSALERLAQDDNLSGTNLAAQSLEALMTRSRLEITACLERPRLDA